jgi:hypothetical protein
LKEVTTPLRKRELTPQDFEGAEIGPADGMSSDERLKAAVQDLMRQPSSRLHRSATERYLDAKNATEFAEAAALAGLAAIAYLKEKDLQASSPTTQ